MSAKGYWVVRVDVTNPTAYDEYRAANGAAFSKYKARFLVRGGEFEIGEGEARARNVVIEFADFATAKACFHSPEYQAARAKRANATVTDLLIIEGYTGPQPA